MRKVYNGNGQQSYWSGNQQWLTSFRLHRKGYELVMELLYYKSRRFEIKIGSNLLHLLFELLLKIINILISVKPVARSYIIMECEIHVFKLHL